MACICRLKSTSEWAPKRKATLAATHGIISFICRVIAPLTQRKTSSDDACHQHRSKEQAQSLEYFKIGIVGHLPFTQRAHGLISEHWENVSKSPVSVSEQGSRKNRSHRDHVDRHATLIVEAFLRDLPENDIAENQKSCAPREARRRQ